MNRCLQTQIRNDDLYPKGEFRCECESDFLNQRWRWKKLHQKWQHKLMYLKERGEISEVAPLHNTNNGHLVQFQRINAAV